MTREAFAWLLAAGCFFVAGYVTARAVDASRKYLGGE